LAPFDTFIVRAYVIPAEVAIVVVNFIMVFIYNTLKVAGWNVELYNITDEAVSVAVTRTDASTVSQ